MIKMKYSEVNLRGDIVEKIILKDLGLKIKSKEKINITKRGNSGIINDVFKITLTGNKDLLLKLYNQTSYRVDNEVFFLEKFKNHLPLPRLMSYGSYGSRKYLIMEFIKGGNLREKFHGLDTKTIEKIIYKIGEALNKIHSYKSKQCGGIKYKNNIEITDYFEYSCNISLKQNNLYQFYKNLINSLLLHSGKFQKILTDVLNNFDLEQYFINSGSCLIYGDLQDKNIIINNKNIMAFVDYELIFLGDPFEDFNINKIFCYQNIKSEDELRFQRILFKGYGFKYNNITINKLKLFEIIDMMRAIAQFNYNPQINIGGIR